MLVLSRKQSERLVVNGPCIITLVEIRGDKVRLGIDATDDVEILRAEVGNGELLAKQILRAKSEDRNAAAVGEGI